MFKVLKFENDGCGPCKIMQSQLDQLDNVVRINCSQEPDVVQDYGVTILPTMIVLKNDVEVARFTGIVPLIKIKEVMV